jgi:hypothetical protein
VTLPISSSPDKPAGWFAPEDFRRPFLILWAIFVLFYFSELAGSSLSIDEEKALIRSDPAIWATQDRWLVYVIERFLLPPPVLPFFPLFVFGGFASLGYIVVARRHDYDLADWRVLLLFVLFSGFPALHFMLDFSFVLPSLGVALLLACVCLHLFDRAMAAITDPPGQPARRGRLAGLLALHALCGAGAVGVYQSLILLVAAGCCGLFLLRFLREPALSWRHIILVHAWLLGALAAGVVLSYLMSRGLLLLVGLESSYSSHFIHPERMLDAPTKVLRTLLREYWQVYGGKRGFYGFRYLTFPLLLLAGLIAVAARAWARDRGAAALAFLYALGITLIPFAIHPINGGVMPYRTLVSVPYVFWFFAAAAALSHVTWLRRVGIALVIVVAVQCLHSFSASQAQKRLVLDQDRALASEIYQRVVAAIPDFDRTRTYPLELYGAYEFRSPYREVGGSTWSGSFFAWDGGNPGRIVEFMNIIGYPSFARIDAATRASLLPAMEKMPIWPAAGSVRVVDGTILVRLGKDPGVVHRQQP